jgi:hypothetical protein
LSRVREEAHGILAQLAESVALKVAHVQAIPSNLVARELHRATEQDSTGVLVLGSTSRAAV